jgi:hypothetical protein
MCHCYLHCIEEELLLRSTNHALLHGTSADKSIYTNWLRLSDSVRPLHGLKIHLRIPVRKGLHNHRNTDLESESQVSLLPIGVVEDDRVR